MGDASISQARREELRQGLQRVDDLLHQKRAGEIGEALIDELVGLSWIEWNGGSLRLTTTGVNICRQLSNERA